MTYKMAYNNKQWWLLWLFPAVALASEQSALAEGTLEIVLLFAGVQLVSLVGHGASSLTDWAVWKDASGTAVEVASRRLKLIQGLLISILAGNACFYGSQAVSGISELPALLGAGVAAYGGDRFMVPLLQRITGK